MSSTSIQRQLLSRLAQRGQWRIASTQPSCSHAPRPLCHHKSIPRRHPAQFQPSQGLKAFSTSSRLLQEHQIPPPPPLPEQQPPQQQPRPPRRRRRWISAAILLLLGAASGTAIRAVLAPPPPLLPGTEVDAALTADIREAAAHLPIVRHLTADPAWSAHHHEAYEGVGPEARPRRITSGALGGSRGVGAYQHVWHNEGTGESVAVVYFGTGTVGWPGVVHGGALATVLDEHSFRAAGRDPGAGGGGDGGGGGAPAGRGLFTASLDITYKTPTLSSDFYVVRAKAVPEEALAPEERGKRTRKVWVEARVETVEGRVCVESRALFVAPKGVHLERAPERF